MPRTDRYFMKYKSWKCNFLFYLSRIAWGREFKLFCEEFLKKYDAAPELASETWNMLYGNYKFRKKYKKSLKHLLERRTLIQSLKMQHFKIK